VYENVKKIPVIDEVVVAADDKLIVDTVKGFGGDVVLTPKELKSGTDRVAHVLKRTTADVVVNVQCDEPFIRAEMIEAGIQPFKDDPLVVMGSLKTRIMSLEELFDPNVVKVVTDNADNALYFSRLPIPYMRDKIMEKERFAPLDLNLNKTAYFKHLGIYFYTPEFLKKFAKLPECSLERAEKLEQLRALFHGYSIKVPTTKFDSVGVDTKADLLKVRNMFKDWNGDYEKD
jgi:3-deoxy-manno-octulosonate cytidylyltransferase (CMP-KDO synthetase)